MYNGLVERGNDEASSAVQYLSQNKQHKHRLRLFVRFEARATALRRMVNPWCGLLLVEPRFCCVTAGKLNVHHGPSTCLDL